MRSILLAVLLALWGVAAHAQTPTLVDFATVSMSAPGMPRTVTDTVCATDGNDLVCDRGVYITSNSRVGIGTAAPQAELHAYSSVPGANATLMAQSVERNAALSLISSQTTGTNSIYFRHTGPATTAEQGYIIYSVNPGRFRIGVANGDMITLTENRLMGIATPNPSTSLHVRNGTIRLGAEASATLAVCDADRTGAIRYTGGDFSFCRNGSAWETLTSLAGAGQADRITSGTSAVVVNSATGIVSISQLGAVASYIHPSLGYVGPGVSVTGRVSSTGLYVKTSAGSLSVEPIGGGSVQVSSSYYVAVTGNGNGGITFNTGLGDASKTIIELMRIQPTGLVGIGTNGPNAKLDVSGTVSATDVFLAKTGGPCSTAADIGRMFRSPTTGRLQVCADRN